MKKHITVLFLLLSLSAFSQNEFSKKEYKGLLWEISGNGLTKKSYLYGTMHVSGRIAFHLGEEFFTSLNNVEAIALESNPIIWLDEILESRYANNYLGRYSIKDQTYKGFYKDAFKIKVPEDKKFSFALSQNHYLANWMLYRESARNKEFEEDTFLDMFIYQTGSKNNKRVISLEDFSQTSKFSMLSRVPDLEKKETSEWYKKLTKEKSYYDLLEDNYRNQDLDMLDSLQREISSKNSMKYMLFLRNEIMADNIDSIIKSGTSLFIGIGAAHLANNEGVIELLREKGYVLKPMSRTFSDKAKLQKEELSKLKRSLPFSNSFSTEFFKLKVPSKVYETPAIEEERQFFSPELTNGTFYTFKIISTYKHLSGKSNFNFLSKIDSLLFENIPGKIESKKKINQNGFNGIDIINKTRAGDYQRYQIFETPINVLIFKMVGKHDFVKKEGDKFFNSIELTPVVNQDEFVSTIKNDFEVKLPSFNHIKRNTKVTSMYGHPMVEGYDSKTNSYYFVKRTSLHDLYFIESDSFELERLARKFCQELDIDSVEIEKNLSKYHSATNKYPELYATAKTADSSILKIKVIIKGAYYYLLATVSKAPEVEKEFFNSFKFKEFNYSFPFEKRIDSVLKFTVNSNFISPNPYSQMIREGQKARRNRKETEDKSYLFDREEETYYSENYERIHVEYNKFHRYKFYESADSLFSSITRSYTERNNLTLSKKEIINSEENVFCEALFTDSNSNRTIRKKYILEKGTLYILTANLDSVSQESKFVNQFFNTFIPFKKSNVLNITKRKSDLFFNTLATNDSLEIDRAMKSVKTTLVFEDKDADRMMYVLSNYSFLVKYQESKVQIIEDLGGLKNSNIVPFLIKLYDKVEDTSMYQIAIIKALSKQKTKKAARETIKLIEKDIPLSSTNYAMNSLFDEYYDSLELTKYLFPELLEYTFVEDYKSPVYSLLSYSIDSGTIKPKIYKKKHKQLLREAKISLKSQISKEQNAQAKEEEKSYYYTSYKNQGNSELVNYIKLLIPYYNKPEVNKFFVKLKKVQDYSIQTEVYCEMLKNKIKVENMVWKYLASDVINKHNLYMELKKIDKLNLFPKEELSQEEICKSILYDYKFNFKKDSLQFLKKVKVKVEGEEGYVYFFKSKREKDDNWNLDYIGLLPLDESKFNDKFELKDKGSLINKDKDIEELIEDKIKEIEIHGHNRAGERGSSYRNY